MDIDFLKLLTAAQKKEISQQIMTKLQEAIDRADFDKVVKEQMEFLMESDWLTDSVDLTAVADVMTKRMIKAVKTA